MMHKPTEPNEILAVLSTSRGDIHLRLFPDEAPLTVLNFVNLARRGFYDGVTFHRVIPEFMIQTGDPTGTGRGGPGYEFKNECSRKYTHDGPGVLSMANAGPNTNGSQFFITHVATDWLDGKHTVFGRVTEGQDVVDAVKQGDTIRTIRIEGDTSALYEAQAKQLERWNQVLDRRHPAKKPVT
jgi:peptidyl-prolyl cis-trans isomerase B (cyclophilin B)